MTPQTHVVGREDHIVQLLAIVANLVNVNGIPLIFDLPRIDIWRWYHKC